MGRTRSLVLAALLAALTALGGFLKIPTPISAVTLQFFFTLAAGVLLGPLWGAASQGIYVALGLMGLPIFTAGGGLSYLLHPTFGFLLGMMASAAVAGRLCQGCRPLTGRRVLLAGLAALAVLYLVGLPYMYAVLNLYLGRGLTLWAVVQSGCLIFLPGDALKLALAALVLPSLSRQVGR